MNRGRKREVKDNEFKSEIIKLFLGKTRDSDVIKPPWTRAKLIQHFNSQIPVITEKDRGAGSVQFPPRHTQIPVITEKDIDYHLYDKKLGLVTRGILKSDRGKLSLNEKKAKSIAYIFEIMEAHPEYGEGIRHSLELAFLVCFLSGYGEYPYLDVNYPDPADNSLKDVNSNLFTELGYYYNFMSNSFPLMSNSFSLDDLLGRYPKAFEVVSELTERRYGKPTMQFRLGYINMVRYNSRMAKELEGKLRDIFGYMTNKLKGYSVHGYSKRDFEEYFRRMDEESLQFLFNKFIMSQIEGIQADYHLYYGLINFSLSRIRWKTAMLTYESVVKPTDKEFAEYKEARRIREWKIMHPGQIPASQTSYLIDSLIMAPKDRSFSELRARYSFKKKARPNLLERMKTYQINTDEVFMKIAERTILPELRQQLSDSVLKQQLSDLTNLLPTPTNPDQKQE